ncbi:MAG: hypothetical protein JSW11_08895 [Candidatus Heimdallarchaeota archaeon]|nr:MAG: hypothetical protein JSW11_08895 [Candidatus Heimdallarchaeota archaeon]
MTTNELVFTDLIGLLFGSLSLIPVYFLVKYYRKTQILDYLLFTGVFVCNAIGNFSSFIRTFIEFNFINPYWIKFFHFLGYFFGILVYSPFLLLYSLRIKWDNPRRVAWYMATILTLLMIYCSFENFYFRNLYLLISNHSGFIDILTNLSQFSILGFTIFVYLTSKQEIDDKRVKIARMLWIISGCFLLLAPLFGIIYVMSGYANVWEDLMYVFSLVGILLIAYVTIRYPEAVLFSHAQIIRAFTVYEKVVSLKSGDPIHEYGVSALVDYLKRIPQDLIK